MKTIKLYTLSLCLMFLFACASKKCDSNIEPYHNTLNIVIDSIFQQTEIDILKCVDVQEYVEGNLPFYQGVTEIFSDDTLLVLNKVLKNFNVASPSLIVKVKPKQVILTLSNEGRKGGVEVSNYHYDEQKKLGAYFFNLMLGQKGMKDFVVFYTIDDDCQVKLLSYKEIFSTPKNPIWVKKIPSGLR